MNTYQACFMFAPASFFNGVNPSNIAVDATDYGW